MHQDIVLYKWQIRIMLDVAAKESVDIAQHMHQFIWGVPCGPVLDMMSGWPVIAKGF
jgi:hypothetical protein